MEGDTNGAGSRRRIVAAIDETTPSPEQRAQFIYAQLQTLDPKPTVWDMACFASEYIGMLALMEPAFEGISKRLSAMVYEAHYIKGADIESCLPQPLSQHSLTKPNTSLEKQNDQATSVESGSQSTENASK